MTFARTKSLYKYKSKNKKIPSALGPKKYKKKKFPCSDGDIMTLMRVSTFGRWILWMLDDDNFFFSFFCFVYIYMKSCKCFHHSSILDEIIAWGCVRALFVIHNSYVIYREWSSIVIVATINCLSVIPWGVWNIRTPSTTLI